MASPVNKYAAVYLNTQYCMHVQTSTPDLTSSVHVSNTLTLKIKKYRYFDCEWIILEAILYLCVFINKVYQMLGVDIKSSRPVLAGGGVRRW